MKRWLILLSTKAIPQHRQAYIAISAKTWATVFGPPSVLQGIISTSTALKQSDVTILPAFGAVHAGHLVAPDLDQIIGDSPFMKRLMKPNFKVISGSKYRPIDAFDLREFLQETLLDIFQNSTNPDRMFEVGTSFLDKDKEISLFMLGSTSYLVLLRRILHSQGCLKVSLRTNPPILQRSETRGGSGSVAIIGMSGRFPGSDSVEELWESIMRRDELHRKASTRSLRD